VRYRIEFLPVALAQLRTLPKDARRLIGGKLTAYRMVWRRGEPDRQRRHQLCLLGRDCGRLHRYRQRCRFSAGNEGNNLLSVPFRTSVSNYLFNCRGSAVGSFIADAAYTSSLSTNSVANSIATTGR